MLDNYGIDDEGQLFTGCFSIIRNRINGRDGDDMSLFNTGFMIEIKVTQIFRRLLIIIWNIFLRADNFSNRYRFLPILWQQLYFLIFCDFHFSHLLVFDMIFSMNLVDLCKIHKLRNKVEKLIMIMWIGASVVTLPKKWSKKLQPFISFVIVRFYFIFYWIKFLVFFWCNVSNISNAFCF